MWIYHRVFICFLACGFLLGTALVLRLQLNGLGSPRPAPEFLPNVARFRTSRVCSPRAVLLVNSSPGHRNRRQIIRETWAHPSITQSLDFGVAFGVGKSPNPDLQRSLDLEAEIFGDLFQEPGVDTDGMSSSAKVVQLLKTVRSACTPLPEFILKMEDSVFVNPFSLIEILENLESFSSSNTLWCLEWHRMFDKPLSNVTWLVPPMRSSDVVRPTYCLSTVYLMTGRTLDAIIRQHNGRTGRIMLPEDVYVTGMLAKEAKIVLFSLGERLVFDSQKYTNDQVVAFVYSGDEAENVTPKLWKSLTKMELNLTRYSDIGL